MAQRFIEPIARIFTNAGAVGVGYKYYFYQTGTTTPVTTYQNQGLSVANTNPVISDANGRFPEIWYSDLSQLKLVVKDSSDNTLETVDPVGATASAVSLNDFNVRPTSYWGLTAGTSTVYTLVANPTISAYDNTQTFVVQPHVDCGDSPTLAIDGLSALNWKKYTQQGTKVALKANDLRSGQRYFCINDGVDIVCLNPSSLPALLGSATSLTIATGAVTLTNNSSSYVIDTEGAAASDDLDTINGLTDGQLVVIQSANSSRDVNITNSGNIITSTGQNYTLETTSDRWVGLYSATSAKLVEIARNRFVAKKFTSSDQTITLAGSLTLAHSLGKIPDLIQVYLKCNTTQLNYSVGDIFPIEFSQGQTSSTVTYGVSVVPDATNLNIRISDTTPRIMNKTTGAAADITLGNWRLVFVAFLLS